MTLVGVKAMKKNASDWVVDSAIPLRRPELAEAEPKPALALAESEGPAVVRRGTDGQIVLINRESQWYIH